MNNVFKIFIFMFAMHIKISGQSDISEQNFLKYINNNSTTDIIANLKNQKMTTEYKENILNYLKNEIERRETIAKGPFYKSKFDLICFSLGSFGSIISLCFFRALPSACNSEIFYNSMYENMESVLKAKKKESKINYTVQDVKDLTSSFSTVFFGVLGTVNIFLLYKSCKSIKNGIELHFAKQALKKAQVLEYVVKLMSVES